MKNFCTGVVASAVLACAPISALADQKPLGARAASAGQIAKAYLGKTEMWNTDCSGGIYYGGNGQARAWCGDKAGNLGAGRWSADNNGNMCSELTWYWPGNGRAGASQGEKSCVAHVVDIFGGIWRSWPGDPEWWPMNGSPDIVEGYKFQNEVSRTQRKLGL